MGVLAGAQSDITNQRGQRGCDLCLLSYKAVVLHDVWPRLPFSIYGSQDRTVRIPTTGLAAGRPCPAKWFRGMGPLGRGRRRRRQVCRVVAEGLRVVSVHAVRHSGGSSMQ